ncbi:uncharacterized protein PgNI_11680 [Pyricularia grisea]|uniref:Rab-GAP TBC domain-containing protein n=1 Tax=Pyricularia grisea TaxID=148305 RepID=A0A6P8ANC7_PYRGI|nr:uncharacterized protein PgNI_11680 [Pyricularia grisea]TLD03525.1 hypothetical protein PgNI_11680 [Pyricularia grisea]
MSSWSGYESDDVYAADGEEGTSKISTANNNAVRSRSKRRVLRIAPTSANPDGNKNTDSGPGLVGAAFLPPRGSSLTGNNSYRSEQMQQHQQPQQHQAQQYQYQSQNHLQQAQPQHHSHWHANANRLRQRPTTKQANASEVPGQPHESTIHALARGFHQQPLHSRHGYSDQYGDSFLYQDVFTSSDRNPTQFHTPPPPLTIPASPPISPEWPSLTGVSNNSFGGSITTISTNTSYETPIPTSAKFNNNVRSPTTSSSTSLSAPTTPLQSPTRKSFASHHSQTSSRFPGLSSHPPLLDSAVPAPPYQRPLQPSSPGIPEFPDLEQEDFYTSKTNTAAPASSPQSPYFTFTSANQPPGPVTYRPSTPPSSRPSSSRAGEDSTMAVENFSRPRKPSVSRPNMQTLPSNPRPTGHLDQDEAYSGNSQINAPQMSAWPRQRGPSVSSAKSAATYSSIPSTRTRPSNDRLNVAYRTMPRTATTTMPAPGSSSSNGMISPGLSRPQMAYRREESNGSLKKQPSLTGHGREPAPWAVDEEEMRSSYRSQLTGSTTQGTMYSNGGTERSSIHTKNSSKTSISVSGHGHGTDDNGLSVEDVMGMYEKGFADSTGAEDNDIDSPRRGSSVRNRSRSTSRSLALSRNSSRTHGNVGTQIREAMDDSLPLPGKVLAENNGDRPFLVRDSAAFFRNSGLPHSDSDAPGPNHTEPSDPVRQIPHKATDSSSSKHDSAKLLDTDDNSMIGRNVSTKSTRTHRSTPSLTKGPRTSVSSPDLTTVLSNDEPPIPATVQTETSPITSTNTNNQLFSAPEEDDPSSRDRYGFRKHNQYISREQYDAWDAQYSAYLARRKKKWAAYLKDSGLIADQPDRFPPRTAKTKRFIRKGIPPEWRGAAWFYYAGGPSILAKHAGVYDDLIKRSQKPGEPKEVDVEAIERDLHRTFPDNASFRFSTAEPEDSEGTESGTGEPKIISSLRRVLLAFAIYNPQIGYCQSLNFLAGLLLLFVETEEQAFWLLNVITILHLPGTHEMSLEGSKVDLGVLMGAVKDSMPGVWAKVGSELDGEAPRPQTQGNGAAKGKKSSRKTGKGAAVAPSDRLPPITLCMTAWFMSCFIGTLPIETTLRVWDVFFYEGSRTLFRVALGIFKLGENEIRAVQDPMEMFGVVQALPRRLLDCNLVIEATFRRRNGFGHLSQETIEERRLERKEALKEARRIETEGGNPAEADGASGVRRKNTLFGRRKNKEAP